MLRSVLFILCFIVAAVVSAQPAPEVPVIIIPQEAPFEVSSVIEQGGYLKSNNIEAGDYFGFSVAIDGDTAVVGVPFEDSNGSAPDNNSVTDSGAAYIFVRQGDSWVQQAYIKASHPGVEDYFGGAVAIDGDTVIVAASGDDSSSSDPSNNGASDAGAAYIFVRQGETWVQQAYLKANYPDAGDIFGYEVDIEGDMAVVGAIGESGDGSSQSDDSMPSAGAAYVFVRDGVSWEQHGYLKAFNPDEYDRFGNSVAIDGNLVVVGAYNEDGNGSDPDDNSLNDAGAAYVFVHQGIWVMAGYLKPENIEAMDSFGYSVDISGLTVVVGAPYEDGTPGSPEDNSVGGSGAVHVFVRNGAGWDEEGYLKADNGDEDDYLGYTVAIDGDLVMVGAREEDGSGSDPSDNSAPEAGAAYVFARHEEVWSQQAYLKPSNTQSTDLFGHDVAISGMTVMVNAVLEDSATSDPNNNSAADAGAAYIMNLMSEFSSSPVPGSLLTMQGEPNTPATTTFEIDNRSTGAFLLNADVTSITEGYTVTQGLPFFGVSGAAEAVTVTVQCDNPGTTPTEGTMTLQTNEFGAPSYTYDLHCIAGVVEEPTETPTETVTATETVTETVTATPSVTETVTETVTATETVTETPIVIPSVTPMPVLDRIPAANQVITQASDYVKNFQWAAQEGAEWYHVFVSTLDYSHVFIDQWYMTSEVCEGEVCTTPHDIWVLGNGEFIWWMTYWNPAIGDAYVNLYAESRFFIDMPVPGVISAIAPTGEVAESDGVLTWNAEPNTLWYQVWAGTADYSATLYYQWAEAAQICAAGVCSINVGTLGTNAYELWLQAWNPAGLGDWQLVTEFTITE